MALQAAPPREPILNLPRVVAILLGVLIAIHLARFLLLTPRQDAGVILTFAFIPVRYHAAGLGVPFPGGVAAEVWTPLTYALLHADVTHLAVNGVWLAAFGSILARRFGAVRFLLFSAFAAVAGAAAHMVAHGMDSAPVVGASAAISGHMAGVARFMFQRGGGALRRDEAAVRAPAATLLETFTDRRSLAFLGIWFATNLAFGIGGVPLGGADATIAWEAHLGGFLLGLFAFPLFDPPTRPDPVEEDPGQSLPPADPEAAPVHPDRP